MHGPALLKNQLRLREVTGPAQSIHPALGKASAVNGPVTDGKLPAINGHISDCKLMCWARGRRCYFTTKVFTLNLL